MGGAAADFDSYLLTSPEGSHVDLASWIRTEDGPDFGDSWMAARYAENPAADGGRFAYESVGVRTMSFPVLLASANLSITFPFTLHQQEALLRGIARPGAYIDLQVTGATDAVRFDVLSGRWKPDYHIRHQSIYVRRGTLELDVQPFGYMPTDIILASSASVGLPGKIALAAQIGDAPGKGVLTVVPTVATTYPGASFYPDFIAWSLHGQGASFRALHSAGSVASYSQGTYVADQFAISSQAFEMEKDTAPFSLHSIVHISSELEEAYRGRHRLWALMKLGPSQGLPWYVTADVPIGTNHGEWINSPVGSAAQIATLLPAVASGGASAGAWASASPAYQLLDLGEISLPPAASGRPVSYGIRLWAFAATSTPPVATSNVRLDSIWLQPAETAGVLSRGLKIYPSVSALIGPATDNPGLTVDAVNERSFTHRSDASYTLLREAGPNYRGLLPQVGGSHSALELMAVSRKVSLSTNAVRSGPGYAAVSLTYRPRFAFVRGL